MARGIKTFTAEDFRAIEAKLTELVEGFNALATHLEREKMSLDVDGGSMVHRNWSDALKFLKRAEAEYESQKGLIPQLKPTPRKSRTST